MTKTACTNSCTLGSAFAHPKDRLNIRSANRIGASATFTNGPAVRLHSVAPGRGGGSTNATPPRGQSTIRFAVPPTCRQASAWPNSWSVTIRNSATYSSTFQAMEEYLPARALISNTATRNQDQCKNTSMPAKRNRRNDPWRLVGTWQIYSTVLPSNTQTSVVASASHRCPGGLGHNQFV